MNNTNHLYKKIFSGFTVSWDIDELEHSFENITLDKYHVTNYLDLKNRTHWQCYKSGIAFARNFHVNFKKECIEVYDKLKNYQHSLSQNYDNDPLLIKFLKHEIKPGRVNLTKIMPNYNVEPHVDITRSVCLNIGLKRSNKWNTIIGDTCIVNEYKSEQSPTFTINDGDGYLMLVENVHSVVCADHTNQLPRYVITYNLLNR
jgi:hypothetical protein